MSHKYSFRKSKAFGPLILLIAQYVTKIVGPFVSLIVVRYLGAEDYGLYASAIAVTSFLTFLPDFGLQQSTLKMSVSVNINKLNRLIKSTLYTSFGYTIFTLIILVTWLNIFHYDLTIKLIAYILSITFIRIAILKIVTTVLQIKRDYTRIAVWNLSNSSAHWIVTLLCIFLNLNIFHLVLWPQLVSFIIVIFMFFIEGNKINLFSNMNPFKEKTSYKEIIRNSLEFGTANSMYQMYHRSDAMILSASRNPTEVGYYNVAFRIAELIYFFAGVLFNQVLYPIFFKWSKHNRKKYLMFYRLLNKFMILIGFFASMFVLIFSEELIQIIFGTQEVISSTLLKIMMLAVPFRFLVVSIGAILTTDNLVRKRIKIQSVIAVINVGSNAILIPIFGAIVAAILMVITDVLLMIGYIITTNKHITKKHFGKKTRLIMPLLLILAIVAFYVSQLDIVFKIFLSLPLIVIYLVIVFFGIDRDEFHELKLLFSKR